MLRFKTIIVENKIVFRKEKEVLTPNLAQSSDLINKLPEIDDNYIIEMLLF